MDFNSSSTKIYDISNNQWTTGPSLPEVVENGRAIVFNGKIYLIGGKGNSAGYGISKTYELDLTTNQWSAKANMSVGRSGPELVIFENRIWAISSEHDSYNNTAESYDVVSNTWRSEPSLPKRCVTAWVANGSLYSIHHEGEVFSFSSNSKTWTRAFAMPGVDSEDKGYGISAAIVCGSRIHLVGGPYKGWPSNYNMRRHYVADLNSSIVGAYDFYARDANATGGGSGGSSTPAAGSITKTMLSQEVLADLNHTASGFVVGASLANPYGIKGTAVVGTNYTVPTGKVLVITSSKREISITGGAIRWNVGMSIVPGNAQISVAESSHAWSGMLFDPLQGITPIVGTSNYTVPSGKTLIITSSYSDVSATSIGDFRSRDSHPSVLPSGTQIIESSWSGYLMDQ